MDDPIRSLCIIIKKRSKAGSHLRKLTAPSGMLRVTYVTYNVSCPHGEIHVAMYATLC